MLEFSGNVYSSCMRSPLFLSVNLLKIIKKFGSKSSLYLMIRSCRII
ncbi:hypothetical protein HMPREF9512_00760 [Enterococcus faecalis EnGen0311]|nr:hypothetical protein HMPREF9512_00760 [Enterococcus faecalis EnGen0311]